MSRNWKWATREEYEDIQEMNRLDAIEGEEFLEAYEAATEKAAIFLNREFPETPKASFKAAFESDNIQFTSKDKESRFHAAVAWIGRQC